MYKAISGKCISVVERPISLPPPALRRFRNAFCGSASSRVQFTLAAPRAADRID
jgi:hypothetical protein